MDQFSKNKFPQYKSNLQQLPQEAQINPKDNQKITTTFIIFCFVFLFNNYDTGVIPACLLQIQKELGLTYSQQASLGSLEYLGVSIATIIVGVNINKFKINILLSVSIFLNGFLSLLISLSSSITLIYISRIGQGICASIVQIYGPIWANNFAPSGSVTTWLGLMNASSPVGVMLGYSVAAISMNVIGLNNSWRIGFASLFVFMSSCGLYFLCLDNKYLDIFYNEKRSQQNNEALSNASSVLYKDNSVLAMFKKFYIILQNEIFLNVSIAICVLFYMLTGIQYWATEYMIKFCQSPENIAMYSFSILAVSAPTLGCILGGKLSDYLGGYKGENRLVALYFCFSVSLGALIISLPAAFVSYFWEVVTLLWLLLALGASMLPAGTGICIGCFSKEYHSTISSLCQLIYNMLGYFLCPQLSGFIMDLYDDKLQGLVWGWRSVLLVGVVVPLLFWKAIVYERTKQQRVNSQNSEQINENGLSLEIFSQQKRTKAWSVY